MRIIYIYVRTLRRHCACIQYDNIIIIIRRCGLVTGIIHECASRVVPFWRGAEKSRGAV